MNASRAVARKIEVLLRQQRTRELETLFARSQIGDWYCLPFDCAKMVVERGIALGQVKLAGRWLTRMLPFSTAENFPTALRLALQTRQIQAVLALYARFLPAAALAPEEAMGLSGDTIALAVRSRLPFGRNGAWGKHRKLLNHARELAVSALAANISESVHEEAEAVLVQIEKLLPRANTDSMEL